MIIKYHCNKSVVKRPSSWSDTPLGSISLIDNQEKGCQKGEKTTFTDFTFKKPGWCLVIKEVLLSCFGVKRGLGWAAVACNVGTQCQDLNWISAQTTGVVRLSPNYLVMLFKNKQHGHQIFYAGAHEELSAPEKGITLLSKGSHFCQKGDTLPNLAHVTFAHCIKEIQNVMKTFAKGMTIYNKEAIIMSTHSRCAKRRALYFDKTSNEHSLTVAQKGGHFALYN